MGRLRWRCGESVVGVRHDQLSLELSEHAEHAEHGAAFHGGGVDALLDDVQTDAALAHTARPAHHRRDDPFGRKGWVACRCDDCSGRLEFQQRGGFS
jgi:hypothetical protein